MSGVMRRPAGAMHPRGAARGRDRSTGLVVLGALAAVLLLGCADATAPAPTNAAAASRASAGFPTALATPGWNAAGRALVASHALTAIAAIRIYALVSVAQYGAVVAADDAMGNATLAARAPADGFGPGGRSRFEAERGAVAGASVQVLSYMFPEAAAMLEQRLAAEGEAGPGNVHPQFTRGVAIGRAMGDVMVARAKTDHYGDPFTGSFAPGVARWTPNPLPPPAVGTAPPLGPLFGLVQPYFMTRGSQFRPAVGPPMPPAVPSPNEPFTIALTEVQTLAAGRTPAQLALSQYWNFGAGTPTPLGHWDEVGEGYVAERGLGEREAAHVLALTNAAAMDAAIGCWDAKYFFLFFRPWQADPTITTPIGKPNHPSFPSGHSCVSASVATVLASFFPEHATELDALVAEAGLSRILAGIHYRFDVTAGQALGRAVAANALAYDGARGLLSAVR